MFCTYVSSILASDMVKYHMSQKRTHLTLLHVHPFLFHNCMNKMTALIANSKSDLSRPRRHHRQPTVIICYCMYVCTVSWSWSACTHHHVIWCTFFVSYAIFIYYFNCISFAIRLSGRKVAIKLNDWLTLILANWTELNILLAQQRCHQLFMSQWIFIRRSADTDKPAWRV